MGFIQRLLRGEPLTPLTGPAFSIDSGTLYGVQTLEDAMRFFTGTSRISRAQAITIPAVSGSRNRICALGQLPLRLHAPDGSVVEGWEFLAQPEADRTGSKTWIDVLDDLLFEGRAFLAVTHTNGYGLPAQGVRLEANTVSVLPQMTTHRTATATGVSYSYPDDAGLIRIDSPKDPLLVAGARAISTLLRLELAALDAAEGIPPIDWFEASDPNVDPFTDDADGTAEEHAAEFLDDWLEARKARRTAYVPNALKYNTNRVSPRDLQLVEAREMAIAELVRLTGIDGEDLSIPTVTRTYFNAQDRRRNFLDFVGGPFPRAIEDRLSMDDVTPVGHTARFDLSAFMQADDQTLAETDKTNIDAGVYDVEEIRAKRGLGPKPSTKEQATAHV